MTSGGPTAVLFPGQGAQSVGMAGEWCDADPQAEALFARASEILGYDLLGVCRNGPAERLNSTAVSQPGILVTSLAALEVLRGRDPAPLEAATITAGLSLGEYTALVFAGALTFDDAVRLVDVRGRAMQECAEQRPGAMVAVLGLERDRWRHCVTNVAAATCWRLPMCCAPATWSRRARPRPAGGLRRRRELRGP
ncbi:MAG: acyltransferase domain-containing protein [Planctomycetia bacterium]